MYLMSNGVIIVSYGLSRQPNLRFYKIEIPSKENETIFLKQTFNYILCNTYYGYDFRVVYNISSHRLPNLKDFV